MTPPDPQLSQLTQPSQLKREARARCQLFRDAIEVSARLAAARRIAQTGLGFAWVAPGAVVSAYAAMGSEIDGLSLLERLSREGYRTCLPVIQPLGNPLIFRAWTPGEPLLPRKWGIREPADDAPTVEPDVLLVPLLAFDTHGSRLGYGGGYYDRTIARLRAMKPVLAIGLAYSAQQLSDVPVEAHDQRLDWVLTETGARRCEGGSTP